MKKFKSILLASILIGFIGILYGCSGKMGDAGYYPTPDSAIDGEITGGESYDEIKENPIVDTSVTNNSYFSLDSSTASYSNLRRYLNSGATTIPSDIIKTDEWINYFDYSMKKPTGNDTFAISSEMAKCPWNQETMLLSVGVATKEANTLEGVGNNYVFLIDVSGSMMSENKLPLVKQSMLLLLEQLNESDRISIVTYASGVKVVANGESLDNIGKLKDLITNLKAGGSTFGEGGIQQAYELAKKYRIPGGNNRVILCSDGDFNVGISDKNKLQEFISGNLESGIYLTVLGFGTGNYKDTTMETLARNGNGTYGYIDCYEEAQKVFLHDFNKTMVTVAKDTKASVSFNKDVVKSYRLIGYENKQMSETDYNDTTKDSGEIGSGHTTMVCYEITLKDSVTTGDLFTAGVRYKDPVASNDEEVTKTFKLENFTSDVSEDYQFVLCIIEFSMLLRNSVFKGTATVDDLLSRLGDLTIAQTDIYKVEFVKLVNQSVKNKILIPMNPTTI